MILFGLLIQLLIPVFYNFKFFSYGQPKTIEQLFITSILGLAAEMVKVDGEVTASEKAVVKKHLEEDFSSEKANYYYKQFLKMLHLKNDIVDLCAIIEYEFDDCAKYHLIYVLVGIATADRVLSKKEISFLQLVAVNSQISIGLVTAILRLFCFRRDKKSNSENQSNNNKSGRTVRTSQYSRAYNLSSIFNYKIFS